MSSKTPVTVGGQAVIEGVMMRGPDGYAIAVRRADGSIQRSVNPYTPWSRRHPFLKLPVIRGAVGLFEMMIIGLKSLEYSAQQATLDEEAKAVEEGKKLKADAKQNDPDNPISKLAMAGTMAFSIGLGLFMFVVLPNLATHFLGKFSTPDGKPFLEENTPVLYNLISGAFRMLIVVGYIWLISLMSDVKRLFQYHGAEHKAVSAFEAGKDLTVDNVRPFTRLHPRCGTTFIAITLMVSIVVFALFARLLVTIWPEFYDFHFATRKTILILGHILIMPVVAGVCFELLRLGGKYTGNPLLRLLITPGFWFQHLTVREPEDHMIEVAIVALKSAMEIEAAQTAPAAQPVLAAALTPA